MSAVEKFRTNYLISVCMVVPARLVAGATMAFMYLVVPMFFAFCIAIYALKFCLGLWAWRKLTPEERRTHRAPFGLMNYNFALSIRMEWALFLVGFFGLIGWIEYARWVRI